MTAKDHNKLLGIFFLVQGGLQAFSGILVALIYGGMGTFILTTAKRNNEEFMGGIFIVLAVVVGLLVLAFAAVFLVSGWKLFKEKPNSRLWELSPVLYVFPGFRSERLLGFTGFGSFSESKVRVIMKAEG